MRRIQWLGILLLIIIFFLLGIYAGSHVRQRQNGSELSPPADPPAEESEPEAEESPQFPISAPPPSFRRGYLSLTRCSSTRPISVTADMILPPALK